MAAAKRFASLEIEDVRYIVEADPKVVSGSITTAYITMTLTKWRPDADSGFRLEPIIPLSWTPGIRWLDPECLAFKLGLLQRGDLIMKVRTRRAPAPEPQPHARTRPKRVGRVAFGRWTRPGRVDPARKITTRLWSYYARPREVWSSSSRAMTSRRNREHQSA